MQVMAVALEDRMLRHGEENIEIAIGPAIGAGRAFTGKTDAGAFLDARGNIDAEGALLLHHAGAAAGLAGMADDLAGAAAGAAGALYREEALRCPHPAMAAAGGTDFRGVAGLGARAAAGLAGDLGGDLDFG